MMKGIFLVVTLSMLLTPLSQVAFFDHQDENSINELEMRLDPSSEYWITLPKGFLIRMSKEEDYTVYSFSNIEDKSEHKFVGGLYIGNTPNEEEVMNATCPIDSFRNRFLDQQVLWKIHKCNKRLMLQTIYEDSTSHVKFHAFGSSKTMAGVVNLYHSFQSLRR